MRYKAPCRSPGGGGGGGGGGGRDVPFSFPITRPLSAPIESCDRPEERRTRIRLKRESGVNCPPLF